MLHFLNMLLIRIDSCSTENVAEALISQIPAVLLLWPLWSVPRLHVAGNQVITGSGFFFLHSSCVLLHDSGSLYSQATGINRPSNSPTF